MSRIEFKLPATRKEKLAQIERFRMDYYQRNVKVIETLGHEGSIGTITSFHLGGLDNLLIEVLHEDGSMCSWDCTQVKVEPELMTADWAKVEDNRQLYNPSNDWDKIGEKLKDRMSEEEADKQACLDKKLEAITLRLLDADMQFAHAELDRILNPSEEGVSEYTFHGFDFGEDINSDGSIEIKSKLLSRDKDITLTIGKDFGVKNIGSLIPDEGRGVVIVNSVDHSCILSALLSQYGDDIVKAIAIPSELLGNRGKSHKEFLKEKEEAVKFIKQFTKTKEAMPIMTQIVDPNTDVVYQYNIKDLVGKTCTIGYEDGVILDFRNVADEVEIKVETGGTVEWYTQDLVSIPISIEWPYCMTALEDTRSDGVTLVLLDGADNKIANMGMPSDVKRDVSVMQDEDDFNG